MKKTAAKPYSINRHKNMATKVINTTIDEINNIECKLLKRLEASTIKKERTELDRICSALYTVQHDLLRARDRVARVGEDD